MILVGKQRGHGRDLAMHLLNARDNEHVSVHHMRGFLVEDLIGTCKETEAISLGTKCTQYLFSLSLNPPADADVPVAVFEAASEKIEAALGLTGQPRAIAFHQKHARRHAHCVWSHIDLECMTAINLSHYKNRLRKIAMELYQEHGWDMPEGFQAKEKRDPLAFDQVEAAQAKTIQLDPKELKNIFKDCCEQSDSLSAFKAALLSEGFVLARGSRRAFVAVDEHGKVYSLSRCTGAGAKALRERLGAGEGLPSIEEATAQFLHKEELPPQAIDLELDALVERHRYERAELEAKQVRAVQTGQRDRQAQLPNSLKAHDPADIPRRPRARRHTNAAILSSLSKIIASGQLRPLWARCQCQCPRTKLFCLLYRMRDKKERTRVLFDQVLGQGQHFLRCAFIQRCVWFVHDQQVRIA